METFGIYSLKAGIILILFWGIYRLFLQNETFYRFNRFFLLAGIVLTILLPLITVHFTVKVETPSLPFHLLTEPGTISPTAEADTSGIPVFLQRLLPVIYLTGIIFLLTFRFIGLFRLSKTIRKNNCRQHRYYKLVESPEVSGAFSFFCFIFIPKNLNDSEKQIILTHEEAHILQKHWADLLFVNLLNLLWWFNPIIRLYEKAIRNNHEYLADQAVLTDYQQSDYQQTLVNQWLKTPVFPMAHLFAYANQLKRINMMKKNSSNPIKKTFSLLAFPVIALFLWAFAEPEYVFTKEYQSLQNELTADSIPSVLPENPTLKITGSNPSLVNEYGEDNVPLVIVDGKIGNHKIDEINPDEIHSVTVLKDHSAVEIYGENGKNGVIEIITKKHAKGLNIQPSEEQDVKVVGHGAMSQIQNEANNTKIIDLLSMSETDRPLIIVDNKEISTGFENLDPNNIHSVSVLKDKIGIELYGEKGKNGVILVTTKSAKNE